jgi:MYXO-CTERM domain-containing protein
VAPTNADRIYVRTNSSVGKPGRLLLSDDAGKTFRTIFRSQAELRGFSLSPDGAKVYVGGPTDGLHVASTTDFVFRKTSSVEVQCITATADRLWVCSSETSGFIVARSNDEGASFEGKTHFLDIRGPLDCPPTPPFDQCVNGWPVLKATLGFVADGGADAGVVSAGPAKTSNDDSSGCGCRASSTTTVAGGVFSFMAIAGLVLRRRRS